MEINPIAHIKGCYPEKFGIPRQPSLVPEAEATIIFEKPYRHENFIRGIEAHSHLWLTFGFHQNTWHEGQAMVRPQRLGGNKKMGVFATRSSFRPNGLGLSAVKIKRVDYARVEIVISGHDLVNGTPIYCIKPYIPYSDSILDATSDFAEEAPPKFNVRFSDEAEKTLTILVGRYPQLKPLIQGVVAQDPTPKFHKDPERIYGVLLYEFNIRFKRDPLDEMGGFLVLSIERDLK